LLDTPITEVEGLLGQDRIALGTQNLSSTAKVWKALARDEGLLDTLGLDANGKARVRSALGAQAQKESGSITGNRFLSHLPDLVVIGVIGSILLALLLAHYQRVGQSAKLVVAAAKPIAPFHVIDATDLEVRHAADLAAAKQATSLYIGRYPTAQVLAGAGLDSAKLSSGKRLTRELNGLRIFAVKIRSTALLAGVPPPFKLDLFLSPHTLEDRGWSRPFGVYVLDVKPEGDSLAAVVATTGEASTTLLSALLAGDLVAVGPIQ